MDGMDEPMSEKRPEPKPLKDLLPALNGIFRTQESKDEIQNFVDKLQNRTTVTRTAEKSFKPRPFYALTPFLTALDQPSTAKASQSNTSIKKKNWNSSVKVNKTNDHTSNQQLAHSSVRKVLKFVPKSKPTEPLNTKSTKFLKHGQSTQKASQLKVNFRISGITNIAQTPAAQYDSKYKKRTTSNKENHSNLLNKSTKPCTTTPVVTPKIKTQKKFIRKVPETPLSNDSWKSSCDASFLQMEKEIQGDDKISTLREEKILELENTINGVKPFISTPLKDYGVKQESLNETVNIENSTCKGNEIITYFDKVSKWREDNKSDESIVSLCEKLKVVTVKDCREPISTIDDQLEDRIHIELTIDVIDQVLQLQKNNEELQLKYLNNLNKVINEKIALLTESVLRKVNQTRVKTEIIKPGLLNSNKRCSVITSCSKSPSYTIPKKSLTLRKKLYHKSMPNINQGFETPKKRGSNKALDMYMQMKEGLEFLKTPVRNFETADTNDTPKATSLNLQMQLNKLYDCN